MTWLSFSIRMGRQNVWTLPKLPTVFQRDNHLAFRTVPDVHSPSPKAVVVLPITAIILARVHATRYHDVFGSCSTILVSLPDNVSFAHLVLLRLKFDSEALWRVSRRTTYMHLAEREQ